MFCHFMSKGKCSLDIEVEDRAYSVNEIAEILQISRHRVWRLSDIAVDKLKAAQTG